ncbi:uncharacterized protein LOC117526671 [Thalassophryne amazonica]|uniref:uncharacterized protein LOC117526671 n=1 Tax=Thalassophryne amazonica TaxID=390379 RepID=UPI0014724E26|nr:uncharacterized protein LOC117526671 [Thalassophryne amazonica]
MSETIAAFQSQLSGVMETVFKAAMYEITRLVEDSFLEEVTRCREQVESLKGRLKWSESRRKEREADKRGKCIDCGRVSIEDKPRPTQTQKTLKQECVLQEEMSRVQGPDTETPHHEADKAKRETKSAKAQQSPCAQDEKLDRLLKEETSQNTPDASESQEGWGVSLDDTSGLPGPSKHFNDQKLHKFQMNWEGGFDQRTGSRQGGDTAEPLYQNRYSMEDLGGFDKTDYEDANMIDMGSLDGLQGSPPNVGEDLSYMGHYEGDMDAPEGGAHHDYQTGNPRHRRGAVDSPAVSASRTNMDASGQFSCLLINEEGYLQDPSNLYPEHVSADSGNRLSFRGQGIRMGDTESMYGPSVTYNDTMNVGEKVQHHAGGRGGRRHSCNQCSMSFSDSASLNTHRQTHKVTGEGPPYSCNQCDKTFTQACNLKVHQKVHSGLGLHLCSRCGKTFPSFSNLKTHKCGQTGDKPYCCTVCGNKFSRLWNLKLHQRIHTQEKPHRCTMCEKSFTRADILKVHQRTHTGERPYCCAVCGLSFKRLDHLKSHQRKHVTDLQSTVTGCTMAELDALIVTFQTQLSDVMESVVKTAMFEVTRLVEDGFLEEVRRRNQEVESLRMQLQWAKRKLGGPGRCVSAEDDVDLSANAAEDIITESQNGVLSSCGVKQEGDSLERWSRGRHCEVVPESAMETDKTSASHSPARKLQVLEELDVTPTVDVKEEAVNKPFCSVHVGGWSVTLDGDAETESHSAEATDVESKQTQENADKLPRNVLKRDSRPLTARVFLEDQEDTHIVTEASNVPPLAMDTDWPGLTLTTAAFLHNHTLGPDTEYGTRNTTSSQKSVELEPAKSVLADVQVPATPSRDQMSSPGPPKAGVQNSKVGSAAIKREVVVDSNRYEKGEPKENKKLADSGMAAFPSSVKRNVVSSDTFKQNQISQKAAAQDAIKIHSKVSPGVRLQAAVQHLHRPAKKPPQILSNSTAALSAAHTQAVNLNPLNRIPSTSKATAPPPPPLSVHRVHLGDKQAAGLNRSGASWVSLKSQQQSANSHQANPVSHPDSHPHLVPRHLLRCGQCGRCFPHPSNLKAHLQTHTGERPFCCSLCGRSFTKLSNLKAHRRVHTGERPYSCLACGKRFTQKCNLKRHQRIHLDL